MKLAAREDIEAPIEVVFEHLSDFDGFERAVLRRGAEVMRSDTLTVPGIGMSWRAAFRYRGKERKLDIELAEYQVPERMRFDTTSKAVEMVLVIDLVAMSRNRTRMNLSLDARPRTIPARLVIQSLKLARQSVLKRFRKRVGEFASEIEARAKAGAL
ncbi:SRPBCC family protein [Maritimibacter sp. HL-12]|jgi:hypothetical protein|uniref:SRPBCC family protein n=1 Tax=Maritimibacter sp. HL-12 TaxID=1162418 RepID=UPI000A0F027E|nr:SRPBCC family protein [Maritimibacter sp. HL-12]SMH48139.1 Polyketide cyclase / dehydrase and lipid transport [Maritimibacter sp. HL-12]